MPAFAEEDKNLIMHIELTLPGGHILMGTDAPVSMGFYVKFTNNIYIHPELDTKAETRKIIDALSDGGTTPRNWK